MTHPSTRAQRRAAAKKDKPIPNEEKKVKLQERSAKVWLKLSEAQLQYQETDDDYRAAKHRNQSVDG